MAINDPWNPPAPPADGEEKTTDPRVITDHAAGVLPCPNNPPPPVGWVYWKGPLPPHAGEFAKKVEFTPAQYPIGTFVQTVLGGQTIAARVEWHDYQGMTGKHGCFRGTSLFRPVAPVSV
jgi:hypothetical protein